MQTIGITGGTGFVGSYLCKLLVSKGYSVIIFTRSSNDKTDNPAVVYSHYHARAGVYDAKAFAQCDAIIHLAGANVAGARWTTAYKQEIRDSRVRDTQFLTNIVNTDANRCSTFISASAIGFYGADKPMPEPYSPRLQRGRGDFASQTHYHSILVADEDEAANEDEARASADFLGETCKMWEDASGGLNAKIRRIILRVGIVLGKEAGAFPEFLKPLKMGVMPVFGNGAQVISWIHVKDLVALMVFALENKQVAGIFNAVAPYPVNQKALIKTISTQKGGVAIPIPVPSIILKIMLGEMSVELLKSCTVSVQKALKMGFDFQFPKITEAVRDIMS